MPQFDSKTTALVLIDLQKGIATPDLAPYTGNQVVGTCKELAKRFRSASAPVILFNAAFSKDFKDALHQEVDQPLLPSPSGFPADFSELVDDLVEPGDILITKRQWGGFYGTDLDLQLRRRGIQTVVLGGVATNFGVESTARQAWERSYSLVLVEDGTSSVSAEMHDFSIKKIMPHLGKVVKAVDIGLGT
jgi:nicotinamidase-related amidase